MAECAKRARTPGQGAAGGDTHPPKLPARMTCGSRCGRQMICSRRLAGKVGGSAARGQRARLPRGQRGPEDVVALKDQAPALVAAGLLVIQRRVKNIVRLAGRLIRGLLILPRACNSSKLLSPRDAGRRMPVSLLPAPLPGVELCLVGTAEPRHWGVLRASSGAGAPCLRQTPPSCSRSLPQSASPWCCAWGGTAGTAQPEQAASAFPVSRDVGCWRAARVTVIHVRSVSATRANPGAAPGSLLLVRPLLALLRHQRALEQRAAAQADSGKPCCVPRCPEHAKQLISWLFLRVLRCALWKEGFRSSVVGGDSERCSLECLQASRRATLWQQPGAARSCAARRCSRRCAASSGWAWQAAGRRWPACSRPCRS